MASSMSSEPKGPPPGPVSATGPVVVQDPKATPVAVEVLAQEIVKVSKAAQVLLGSRLSEDAVVLLIQDQVPGSISRKAIRQVLHAAASLEARYVKAGK